MSYKLNSRNFVGIVILILGILFLLDSIEIVNSYNIISGFWPIILIVVGIVSLFNHSKSKLFGIILILVGGFYQLERLDILPDDLSLWNLLWPALLIIVGVSFLLPRSKDHASSETLRSSVIFSGADVANGSSDFTGGELNALFGGIDVDLTSANVPYNEPAVIDIFVAFGGLDITVPEDWVVEVKCLPLFGGWDNKRKRTQNSASKSADLIIKGIVLFGGIDVK